MKNIALSADQALIDAARKRAHSAGQSLAPTPGLESAIRSCWSAPSTRLPRAFRAPSTRQQSGPRQVLFTKLPTLTFERGFRRHIMSSTLIIIDPDIQSGAPVFAGTRVPVQNLFDYLEEGDSLDVFLKQFPSVSREQAVAVLEKARRSLVADAYLA